MEKPYTVVLEESDMEKLKIKAIKEKTTVKKILGDMIKKFLENK